MARYTELTPEQWSRCTRQNGWRVTGRSEAGFALDGPNGELVFWDDDAKRAYRVEE